MKDLLKQYQAKPLGEEKRYAVFLPLILVNDDWHVLYEVRSQHISQPGEVSFPGGQVENQETLQEAAIRETVEELTVDASQIQLWGEIDYLVQSSRTIHCFVGQLVVDDWKSIQPNEEVDKVFIVPLRQLLVTDPAYYRLEATPIETTDFPFDRIRNGKYYQFSQEYRSIPFYENLEETIWGMTAQFTKCLTDILNDESIAKKNPSDIEKSKGR
ncbi:NUDIX hydrolase [Streptococcus pyogenes]|uniref:NUDIX hydrolase n=1 Tax=Streptococcus pyogenes TaxID=1314 RepID=UPI0010A11F5B|nr:CoA pyrophosphatase [Streptococcus pyogenes]VHA79107.1 NUDIX domain-containing protein [Streptococcus pyogenes]VHD38279.1 NUDIX domain-containing protein [Streptococcus pyogenes]VHD44312.1 NUDIX domain-containing protein [Streptococcus pyogenes]